MHLPEVIPSREPGFSLIEIAIVLVIVGLLATFALGITSQVLNKQRRDTTVARLAQIDSALSLFVAQNKFLPCPADGTLDGTAATPSAQLGKEQVTLAAGVRTGCSLVNQKNGILPWVTLGIALADAQDGWGNMFTYRVEESLIRSSSMDFTYCTPAGNTSSTPVGAFPNFSCATTCSTSTFPTLCNPPSLVTAGRGLRVKSISGTILNEPTAAPSTGAAYVVLSPGENQARPYQFSGIQNAGIIASGTQEQNNHADKAYPANSATAYLVDDAPNYTATTAHFDDFVSRPSILSLAAKAQLGPRAY